MNIQLTDSLFIRKMTREDLPLIAQWASDAFALVADLRWTPEKMLKHLGDDFKDEHSYVVCDENGVIGGIMAYPCKYDRGEEIFLHTIVMSPVQKGKGVGKLFLQWFIEYATSKGITGIRLDAHSQLSSYDWYDQFGFHPSGWAQKILEL